MDTSLSKIKDSLEATAERYAEIGPDDDEKAKMLGIITKEYKLVSEAESAEKTEKLQEDRFEMQKDHQYWSEKLEGDRFAFEKQKQQESKKLDEKRLELDESRMDIEKSRLKLEQRRATLEARKANVDAEISNRKLDLEERRIENDVAIANSQNDLKKFEMKCMLLTTAITTTVTFVTSIITLLCYRKLSYANLQLIYKQEGRPTKSFESAMKDVKQMIR